MNYCTECGSEVKENAKFCKECGAKMTVEVVATSSDAGAVSTEEPTRVKTESNPINNATKTSVAEDTFFNFLDFSKQTLIHPTTVFSQMNWINGVISLAVITLIQATVAKEFSAYSLSNLGVYSADIPFITLWIQNILLQAVVVGLLLAANKLVFNAPVSIKNVVTEYGGMMNSQSALLLLATVFGLMNEDAREYLYIITALNQLNIFTTYLFASQERGRRKLDGYYQVILAYFALAVLTALLIGSVV